MHHSNFNRKEVEPVILSKVREFHILGYKTVTADDLWRFLTEKKWRNQTSEQRLHKIVADIMSVKIGEFMNYTTVESFRVAQEEPFSISEEELKALFGDL